MLKNLSNRERTVKSFFYSLLFVFSFHVSASGAVFSCESVFQESKSLVDRILTNEFSDIKQLESYLAENDAAFIERQKLLQFNPNHIFGSKDIPREESYDYTSSKGVSFYYDIFTKDVGASNIKKQMTREFSQYLSHSPKHQGIVYSGGTMERTYFNEFYSKSPQVIGYAFSTSVHLETATRFMRSKGSPQTHVKVMHVVESRTGVDISKISAFPREAEVLFNYDTLFKINRIENLSKDENGFDVIKVFMTEVQPKLIGQTSDRLLAFKPETDLPRIFERSDWAKMKDLASLPELLKDPAVKNWIETNNWLFANRNKLQFSLALFKDIHRRALKDNYYFGYERRRIREAYQKGKISKNQAITALKLNQEKVSFTGKIPADFAGKFRTEDLDIIVDRGWTSSPNTRLEILNASLKPFFEIDPASVKGLENEMFIADIYAPPSHKVEVLAADLFEQAQVSLKETKNNEEYLKKVLELQDALMSLHPFLDGNGRSIRLLTDFLLVQRGLPPLAHPLENDFYKSPAQLATEAKAAMTEYYYKKVRAQTR